VFPPRSAAPPRTRQAVELLLRPHPLALAGVVLLGLVLFAFALQVALQGSAAASTALLCIGASTVFVLHRQLHPLGPHSPRRLCLGADGRAWVITASGMRDEIHLHPASLRLGRVTWLVARGRRTYRVLLGPGNVDPVTLAALVRWLRSSAASSSPLG
jgi:hypothetical protein